MLRRSHRRRPPVPVTVAAVLVVVSVVAVVAAALLRDTWALRGSVVALAGVVVVGALLLRRVRRLLRRAQAEAAGTASALARTESRASRELLRRDLDIARLSGELEIANGRLREVTAASLYAASVLADLLRTNPLLSVAADGATRADDASDAGAATESAEDSAEPTVSSTVVQVWPSVDDAPTVVDLLRWDQVRRLTDEPVVDARRPA